MTIYDLIKKAIRTDVIDSCEKSEGLATLEVAIFKDTPYRLYYIKNINGEEIACAYSECIIRGAWESYKK